MPRYDDPDDDIDADSDEEYRRRARRHGPEELSAEEEEAEEKDVVESEEWARRKCRWPGILMIAAGVVAAAGNVGYIAYILLNTTAAATAMTFILFGIPVVFGLVAGTLNIVAGVCFMRRRRRGFVITGNILAAFPCSAGAVLAIPAAIWMFVVSGDPDVEASFERSQRR